MISVQVRADWGRLRSDLNFPTPILALLFPWVWPGKQSDDKKAASKDSPLVDGLFLPRFPDAVRVGPQSLVMLEPVLQNLIDSGLPARTCFHDAMTSLHCCGASVKFALPIPAELD